MSSYWKADIKNIRVSKTIEETHEIQSIYFDDGTLVDSGPDLANATNLMREHYDLEKLPIPQIFTYIGNGAQKLVKRARKDMKASDIDEALKVFFKVLRRKHPYPNQILSIDIEDFLKKLKEENIPAVVLTNKPQAMTDKLLEEMNATQYFKLIYGPEAYGKKPDSTGIIYV